MLDAKSLFKKQYGGLAGTELFCRDGRIMLLFFSPSPKI